MRKIRKYSIYLLYTILTIWFGLLVCFAVFRVDFLNKFYFMPLLGIIAATVANSTPAAAGIVYFPILTKFNITPFSAVMYNVMIQSYGMGLGTMKWYLIDKNLFLKNILAYATIGGVVGVVISIMVVPIQHPVVLEIVFNSIAFILIQAIFFSILKKKLYNNSRVNLFFGTKLVVLAIALIGGMITGWLGFGIDTIFYFVLTIFFKINPIISIVTSIALMTFISIFSFILHAILHPLPITLWLSAIPGVTMGGLFLASLLTINLGAKNILLFFAILLSVNFLFTIWNQNLFHIDFTVKIILLVAMTVYLTIMSHKIIKCANY